MVKVKFAFFQMQQNGVLGHAWKPLGTTFSKDPEMRIFLNKCQYKLEFAYLIDIQGTVTVAELLARFASRS